MSNILYIGLDYYSYPERICEGFRSIGHVVDFFPIEPRTLKYKALRYISNKAYRLCIDKYHDQIIEATSTNSYDYVFFVTTHFMSLSNIAKLKKLHAGAKFIAYHWDSIKQYDYRGSIPLFDKVWTFDFEDCHSNRLNYLPLFASGVYSSTPKSTLKDIDVYSIGTVVKVSRYKLIKKYQAIMEREGLKTFFYMKVTPVSYIRLLMEGIVPKGVHFTNINSNEFYDVVSRSRCVLDVSNNIQSGLSMRIIENTNIGIKVITNNESIGLFEFYDPHMHLYSSSDNVTGDEIATFINGVNTFKVPDLSVSTWARKVLS